MKYYDCNYLDGKFRVTFNDELLEQMDVLPINDKLMKYIPHCYIYEINYNLNKFHVIMFHNNKIHLLDNYTQSLIIQCKKQEEDDFINNMDHFPCIFDIDMVGLDNPTIIQQQIIITKVSNNCNRFTKLINLI